MQTDPVTTLVLTAIIAAVAGSVLWAFERTQKPGIPHLRTWAYASLLQGVGIAVVMGLRTLLPFQIGIVIGNLLIMSAILLYGSVIAAYSARTVSWGFWLLLLLLFAVSHSACLYLWPNLPARMAIFSVFAAFVLLLSAGWLFFSRSRANSGERFVAFLFLLTGVGMAARAGAQYPFVPAPSDSLFSQTAHAGIFHMLALVSNLVNTLGFTVLCIGRSRADRDKALSEAESQREIFRRQFEMLPVAACIWRIEGNDYVLEQANFAAQVLTEGRIWTQTGGLASQLLARNPEAIAGLNHCRDQLNYFVREVPAGFGIRDPQATLSLTFSRISQQHIAVYGESKATGSSTAG
ncbi:MAG: hypothetical protein ACOY5B_15195 [Spirochaetota bacterium]